MIGLLARVGGALVLAAMVSACVTTQSQGDRLVRHRDTPKVLVMPVDVELSEMRFGGVLDPKAEWTDSARRHMADALDEFMAGRNAKVVAFDPERLNEADAATAVQLIKLHQAVGTAIRTHKLGTFPLPTKADSFDWSLGPQVAVLERGFDADYALFVFMRDSYTSSERAVAIFLGALAGVPMEGGSQIGFASLVDLRSGAVAWYHLHRRGSGDLRTAGPARETMAALLEDFPK